MAPSSSTECSSSVANRALSSSHSHPDLPPPNLPPLQQRGASSNKAFRTLGLDEPCAARPSAPERRTTVDDDIEGLAMDEPTQSRCCASPVGAGGARPAHNRPAHTRSAHPVAGLPVYGTSATQQPRGPYLVECRSSMRFVKLGLLCSMTTLAACAIIVTLVLFVRVDNLERRIRFLEVAVRDDL